MASVPRTLLSTKPTAGYFCDSNRESASFLGSKVSLKNKSEKIKKQKPLTVVAAVGDVSSDGTIYLIAGAAAVALVGTAFPILFSRKDL